MIAMRTHNDIIQVIQRILCGNYWIIFNDSDLFWITIIDYLFSMDVHPSRELVASGQRGGRDRKSQPHVRIWSTESLQTLYVFGMNELDTGVAAVAFSQLVSPTNIQIMRRTICLFKI